MLENVSVKILGHSNDVASIKANLSSVHQKIDGIQRSSDVDRVIIGCHIFEDHLLTFTEACREATIALPAHGYDDNLREPHSHPKEEEERLNNLSPNEIRSLIRSSPMFVDHSGDTDTCLICLSDSDKGELSYQCGVCDGLFHKECHDILNYRHYDDTVLSACGKCRSIRKNEVAVLLMTKCDACMTWVKAKKEEIVSMTEEEKHRLRKEKLVILRENMVHLTVQEIVNHTETTLESIRNNTEAPAMQELEFEHTDNDLDDKDTNVAPGTTPPLRVLPHRILLQPQPVRKELQTEQLRIDTSLQWQNTNPTLAAFTHRTPQMIRYSITCCRTGWRIAEQQLALPPPL
jgi:hypothetical protein